MGRAGMYSRVVWSVLVVATLGLLLMRSTRPSEAADSRQDPKQGTAPPAPEDAWGAATKRVAENPVYHGKRLATQDSLVPLGADPSSGLEEFLHLPSNDGTGLPRRDDKKALSCSEQTGLVFVLLPPRNDTLLLLSKFEMNQTQWRRLAPQHDNPSKNPPQEAHRLGGEKIALTNPVENMDIDDAAALLKQFRLRLPTEMEWEYACRAGSTTTWATGDTPQTLRGYANIYDRTAASRLEDRWTHGSMNPPADFEDGCVMHTSVFSFLPNAFGLHQMHGNVAEWCQGGVARGGAFDMGPALCTVTSRWDRGADDNVGVRPARDVQ